MQSPHGRSTNLSGAALALALSIASSAYSQVPDELVDLSLEELSAVQITSVSKRLQSTKEVAASVYVLTQDEIRRAGAATLPEALRLVPGMQVAQIDRNKWSVGIRGFNGRFANKLLVLKDGRSIYTPTFAGVYWDTNETFIEDIERIEVIRGPGGAMWGANAVNGVINIITKHAGQTEGLLVSASSGSPSQSNLGVRYGAAVNGDTQWRAYARYSDAEEAARPEIPFPVEPRDTSLWRSGLRIDSRVGANNEVSGSTEVYDGSLGQYVTPVYALAGAPLLDSLEESVSGIAGLLNWTHTTYDFARISTRLSFAHDEREGGMYKERRDTVELELQHVLPRRGRHVLTWGVNAQTSSDSIKQGTHAVGEPPNDRETRYSAFAQDDMYFADDRASIAAGTKVEHSSITGTHLLPTLRARYNVAEEHSVWTAVSRGIRNPSRGERHIRLSTSTLLTPVEVGQSSVPLPLIVMGEGNDELEPEKLIAYEAGVRSEWSHTVSTEFALYYNDYDDVRGFSSGLPLCMPSGTPVPLDPTCLHSSTYVQVPLRALNGGAAQTQGGEIVTHVRPATDLKVTASYAYFDKHVPQSTTTDVLAGYDARHLAGVRLLWTIGADWDVGIDSRYVSEIDRMDIRSYIELDARVAWRPSQHWELAVIGRNLMHDEHEEFVSELADIPPLLVERSFLFQLRWLP